jgi:5'-3' exonuclease
MGDAGDGVVGIEGVGEKTIDKWFKNKKNLTYAQVIIKAYVDKYGVHEGINRFYESFSMVYLLNSDEDMMREIGELPKFPDIHKINDEREFIY